MEKTMDKKAKMLNVLEQTAAIIHQKTGIKPILYASFALELLLLDDFDAFDIDLLMPVEKNPLILDSLKEAFYQVNQTEIITASKDSILIEFASLSKWKKDCHFDLSTTIAKENYQVLSLSDLKKLYRFLLLDSNRSQEKKKKDLEKLEYINKYFKKTHNF